MQRYLNRNCEIILNKLLLSDAPVSSSDIKDALNISRKTVTEGIQRLDDYLRNRGASIRTVNGIGYAIEQHDAEKFRRFSEEFARHCQRDRFMYFDHNYLAYLIVLKFLVVDGYLGLEDLTEEFYYSSSTISQNLQKARAFLSRYGLQLATRPNYGLILKGSEWNKRVCMLFNIKTANAINFMQSETIPVIAAFREMLEKDLDNYFAIKSVLEPILQQHETHLPLVYQMVVSYYIYLSQTRAERYDQLEFDEEKVRRLSGSTFLVAATHIASAFNDRGYRIREKDVAALAILLNCYATRRHANELTEEQYGICAEDARRMVELVAELYPGAELGLDSAFRDQFACLLAGIRERRFFGMPSDEESVFQAKHEGAFMADLCVDFARLFRELHGVQLKTAELMQAYYVFAGSFMRQGRMKAQYRAALVSLYGITYARDIAARLMRTYDRVLVEIEPMELSEANCADLGAYDLIITDVAKNQFADTKLPMLFCDIYREDYLRSLDRFISEALAEKMRLMISEENIVRDIGFRNKEEVFEFLAERYIVAQDRAAFLEDCRNNNDILSAERRNNIAMVSTFPRYYDKKDVVIILSRNAFLWDDETVQLIMFFNRRGRTYRDIRVLNILQSRLLADVAGIAQNVRQMSAEELVTYIAYKKYKL